jgi:hypothetical protein
MRTARIAIAIASTCALTVPVLVLSSYAAAGSSDVSGSGTTPVAATSVRFQPAVATGAQATLVRPAKPKPRVKHKPAPKPTPRRHVRHPATAPHIVHRTAARPQHEVTHHRAPAGPTSWAALNAAIARIPGYHRGDARWVIKSSAHWGTADWYRNTIYLSHSIPDSKVYDVVLHEWSHLLTVRAYAGDVDAAVAAAKSFFGGRGLMGAEYAADCMARVLGAHWTNYTSCSSADWRAGARRLVHGKRLHT